MRVVAARVAEVDFAVLDDRVVPVGDVDRAVRPHLHVDRAKGDVVRLDDFRSALASEKPEPSSVSDEPADAMAAKVVRDQAALPVVGQVPAADDFQPAMLGAAGVQARAESAGAA